MPGSVPLGGSGPGHGGGAGAVVLPVPHLAGADARPGDGLHGADLRPRQHRVVGGHGQHHLPGHPRAARRLHAHPQPHAPPAHPGVVRGAPVHGCGAHPDAQAARGTDPDLVRSLVAQGPGLPALRRLRALARESDKNRLVMATHETRAALVEAAFGATAASSEELEAEAMAVLALVGLGEAEAAEVVGREERVARLGKVLGGIGVSSLEARVNAGAVVEAAASASGAEARAVLGAAEGVMDGLVALVEEKAHARAVRVGIRALFALCLAKENRPRAVAAGAASALARRVAEGGASGEPERALAAVERLCRAEGGRDAVVASAGGGSAAVRALVRAMSGRAAEHAAGALVAVVGGSEALQVEAVRAGAMSQLLLMVQGGCSERAKLLRAWTTTDCSSCSAPPGRPLTASPTPATSSNTTDGSSSSLY